MSLPNSYDPPLNPHLHLHTLPSPTSSTTLARLPFRTVEESTLSPFTGCTDSRLDKYPLAASLASIALRSPHVQAASSTTTSLPSAAKVVPSLMRQSCSFVKALSEHHTALMGTTASLPISPCSPISFLRTSIRSRTLPSSPARQSMRLFDKFSERMLPRLALRTEDIRLCDTLSDTSEAGIFSGISFSKLCDRSSDVSADSVSSGKVIKLVLGIARCRRLGNRARPSVTSSSSSQSSASCTSRIVKFRRLGVDGINSARGSYPSSSSLYQ